MLFSNPRTLPALLFCVGFALAGMRWMELDKLPQLDPEQVELAVELNYALDLARADNAGESMPDEQQRREDKARIREEIEAHFNSARAEAETQINQGLLVGMIGLALYLGVIYLQRKRIIKA